MTADPGTADPAVDEVTDDAVDDEAQQAEQPVDDDRPGREAQRLRGRLRDAETARDTHAATVDGLRRQLVEQAVADRLAKPAALWAAGITVDELFDTTGTLDAGKLTAAVDRAVADLGLLTRPRPPAYQAGQGQTSPPSPSGWQAVIQGAAGR